jgi:polyisoprenoid-binding protein YceI
MKKVLFSLFLAAAFVSAKAQTLTIDSEKAVVKFNYVKEKVEGTVTGIKATVTFDINDLTNAVIEGTAEVKALTTGNKQRDTHLHSDDYFKSGKYPQIKFKSTSFEKTETGYKMKGKLTITGTEKDVEFTFTFNNNTFEGKAAIYMNDFGVFTQKNRDDSKVLLRVTIPVKA